MPSLRLVPTVGRPLEVTEDRSGAVIGRSVEADFTVEDGSVSRRHARLEWRGTAWFVVDLGSANGTFVAGERIGEAALASGQEVRFGSVSMAVELGESSGDATVAIPSLTAVLPAYREPLPEPETENIGSPPMPPSSPPPPAPPPTAAQQPPPMPGPPAAGPAGSSPVGQMAAPPPPAKTGKSPLFWVLTGCFGCLTAVVLLVAAIGGSFWMMTRGPVEDTKEQLARIAAGDLDAAYAELAESYRARVSAEEFAELVGSHPSLEAYSEASFSSRSIDNDTARISGSLTSRTGGVEPVVIELVKERGEWRIAAIRFGTGEE